MLLEAIILGAVQGVTEFLPVSSSAHLILVPRFFSFSATILNSNLFDSILHGGSLAAVIVFFYARIRSLVSDGRLFALICLSALPTFVIGFLIEPFKDAYLRGEAICAVSLVVFGIYMIVAERFGTGAKRGGELGWRQFLFLGIMQAVALVPGTSRSGITIASALLLGLEKERAVEVSFLMSLPVVGAAFAYEMKKALVLGDAVPGSAVAAGLVSSFVFGLLALLFLVKFIRTFSFGSFAYYRFFVALLIVANLWKNS